MVVTCADGQFRHDADIFQNIIALARVGFDLLELIVRQTSRLIQCLGGDSDLADIVEECDVSVLLDCLVVIAEFSRKHFRVFCDPCGVTVRVPVLHIDDLRKRLDDLADQESLLLFLCLELLHSLIAGKVCKNDHEAYKAEDDECPEPCRFAK